MVHIESLFQKMILFHQPNYDKSQAFTLKSVQYYKKSWFFDKFHGFCLILVRKTHTRKLFLLHQTGCCPIEREKKKPTEWLAFLDWLIDIMCED